MIKKIILGILAIIFIGVGLSFTFKKDSDDHNLNLISAVYVNSNATVAASFNPNEDTVTFTLNDLTATLPQAISASGVRYANKDESLIFWEHQGSITITKDQAIIFQGVKKPDFNGRNSTFILNNQTIHLTDGSFAAEIAPSSANKNKVNYFGNEAYGYLNADNLTDVAFLITQNSGGTGTFYYAVAALGQSEGGFKTTNPFLIGDRIAPQSTIIPLNSGEIQINYAERLPSEPMSAEPTQGATLLLKVTGDGVLEGLMK